MQAKWAHGKLDEGIKLTTFIGALRAAQRRGRWWPSPPPGRNGIAAGPGRIPMRILMALAKDVLLAEMLDSGRVKNMTELAKAEKISLARMRDVKLARLGRTLPVAAVGLSLLFFVEPVAGRLERAAEVGGSLAK